MSGKAKTKLAISSVMYILAIYLCLTWFDWKLLLILFVWQYAANLSTNPFERP